MKIFLISLILLFPVSIADDQAYNYGFLKGIAARLAMDDSSSNKITDCSPMIDHIKTTECEIGWQKGYSESIMLE
ncbi:MAG: hypothetical protein WBZ36_11800 [Candidatus Nitrosopolaris sp.]